MPFQHSNPGKRRIETDVMKLCVPAKGCFPPFLVANEIFGLG